MMDFSININIFLMIFYNMKLFLHQIGQNFLNQQDNQILILQQLFIQIHVMQ